MGTKTDLEQHEYSAVDGVHCYELFVPVDLVYFEGHFPGMPVLAAVVQLDRVILPRIETLWPDLGSLRRAVKLKFHLPIAPGQRLSLELARTRGVARDGAPRTDASQVRVVLRSGSDLVTTGTLEFRGAA